MELRTPICCSSVTSRHALCQIFVAKIIKIPQTTLLISPTKIKSSFFQTCGATFPVKGELNSHLRSHSVLRPHPCPHCDKTFKHSHKLRAHLNRFHTPGYVPKLRKCPHCEKSFRASVALKAHLIRAHAEGGPFTFPCAQCGKGFVFSSLLALHLKRVHSVDATARRKKRVQRARRSTTPKVRKQVKVTQSIGDKFLAAGGEFGFNCEHCGKGYMVKSTLQRHLKKAHGVLRPRKVAATRSKKRERSRVTRKKSVVTTRTKKLGKKKSKRGRTFQEEENEDS